MPYRHLPLHDMRLTLQFLCRCTLAAAALLVTTATAASAQEAPSSGLAPVLSVGAIERPAMQAAVLTSDVNVDGRLDDEAWQRAPAALGFLQAEPVEGIPAEHDTHAWVAFSDDAIYVAARMFDPDPSTIADQIVRRDERGQYDWFAVQFDPNLDQLTGYTFWVSAANVQRDVYLSNDRDEDEAWNAVWQSAVQRTPEGWTVEIRIPLSQIRYETSTGPRTWGVNFVRRRVSSNELTYWSLRTRTAEGRVSQFGTMEGVRLERAVRRIEARPYLLSSLENSPAQVGNPFEDGRDATARVGVDLRFGLGSAFTLDATLNPDFGQVESDPAVINLTAFEVFLPEQRPFFVEDARVLDFGLSGMRNSLFYSRRIGRSPQGRTPSDALYSEIPTAAKILGAAKLTGRTESGLSVGALLAVTDQESGRGLFEREDGPRIEPFTIEPRTEYGVVRLQQDLRGGQTQFGAMVTGMHRNLASGGEFDFLASSAFSAGVNFEHQWADRVWALTGFFAGTHIRGDSTAMIRVQRANNHLFHRPDATRLSVDSTATSLTGAEWRLQLSKQNGLHWTGSVWVGEVTSAFEVNDLGFSQSPERLDAGMRIGYREIRPSGLFQNYSINFFTFHNWSHEALDDPGSLSSWRRAQTSGSFNLNSRAVLRNFWELNADVSANPNTFSRTQTRGGPVMLDPGSTRASIRLNTDRRKAVNVGLNVSARTGHRESAEDYELGASVEMRPSTRVELRLEPRWQRQFDASQYVLATDVMPYEPTYGRRYFFAELERTTVSMVTRVNVSLTPTLTFQLFAQPLLSSGDYVGYRQLRQRSTFEFIDFTEGQAVPGLDRVRCEGGSICSLTATDGRLVQYVDFDGDSSADFSFTDRDFNIRSLVGNAVMRWEFRPGSTLFLVWQRQQRSQLASGTFDLGRDIDGLFGAPASNTFMIKLSYWTGL